MAKKRIAEKKARAEEKAPKAHKSCGSAATTASAALRRRTITHALEKETLTIQMHPVATPRAMGHTAATQNGTCSWGKCSFTTDLRSEAPYYK
jgi:hypothetical protein